MEHHANLVPWQMLRDAHGVELRVAKITDAGELDFASLEAQFADGQVKLLAVTAHVQCARQLHPGRASGGFRA